MSAHLLSARAGRFDGTVIEDFELLPTGALLAIPQVTGTGNCILFIGTAVPR
jgi:hypothetical protein